MISAADVKKWLKLGPNPQEGGFLASVYNCAIPIPDRDLPGFATTKDARSLCGAIYYFLEDGSCSVLHRVTGDMLYHFYAGDPVQMLLLYPKGHPNRSEVCVFGNNLAQGQSPMKAIPGGTWLGSRLMPGGAWALMGVTMSPGFNPVDYTIGSRKDLIAKYPDQEALITEFTREG
jgi:predicted cupin superfamily sugar epimerase